jgi:DNA-directed RNA polymerase subunit RPC12/RpoP
MSHISAWVCEACGEQGRELEPLDTVQCPRCGEPVVPVEPG